MANKTSPAEGAVGTLQRGKACLRCRKRKMRCDGSKPACQQCTKAKKGESCEYDDGKGKTRTQLLRETIVRLEQRVRELEDPEYISPAITLYDPHLRGFSESPPSSSYDSTGDASFSAGHSPFPSDSAHSPEGSWDHTAASASPPLFSPDIFFQEPIHHSHPSQPPVDLAIMLLEIFAPHRHQCGLEIHMGQLRESLSRPMTEQRHPVLMNSIYLWACFISRPEPLSQHEEHYLNQALDALNDALRAGDKMIDIVQASCLLSTYFLANGRILEGSYHASAAAALAVQCGLHENISPPTTWLADPSDELKPFKLDLQHGERILAFWQVYNLDRCWSVALRKPTIIPDGPHEWNSIHCPWPMDIAEYQAGVISSGVNFHTIKSLFEGDVVDNGYSTPALRAKASALFERANYLSTSWDSRDKPTDSLQQEVQALELTITAFLSTLPQLHQLSSLGPEERSVLVTVHTLTQAAIIHLHQRFAPDDPVSYDQCSRAARACGTIITHLTDSDFGFLDPILGPCWTSAAETLLREIAAMNSWPTINSTDLRNEFGTILYAMTNLASRFPLLGVSAAKLQKALAEL